MGAFQEWMRRDDDVVTRAAAGSRGWERCEPGGGVPQGSAQPPARGSGCANPSGSVWKQAWRLALPLSEGQAGTRQRARGAEEWRAGARPAQRPQLMGQLLAQLRHPSRQRRGPCGWVRGQHARRHQAKGPQIQGATGSGGRDRCRGCAGRVDAVARTASATAGWGRQALAGTGGLLGQHRRLSRPPRRPCGTTERTQVLRNAALTANR